MPAPSRYTVDEEPRAAGCVLGCVVSAASRFGGYEGRPTHAIGTEMDRLDPIPEFTEITLKRVVNRRGVHMPAGAHGIVMAAYSDGLAYEVEFETPRHVVLTLEGTDIQV